MTYVFLEICLSKDSFIYGPKYYLDLERNVSLLTQLKQPKAVIGKSIQIGNISWLIENSRSFFEGKCKTGTDWGNE